MNTNKKSFLPKIEPQESALDNKIKLYCFPDNTIPFVKLEVYFPFAGTTHQDVIFSALLTQQLINAGTTHYDAKQLAEKVDYYGAFIEKNLERESASISFYFLKKYYKELLPIFDEMFREPTFPQSELDLKKDNLTQQWLLNQQKTNYLAQQKFNKLLFGDKHPYGITGKKEDIDALQRDDLLNFYNAFYTLNKDNCFIVASGDIDQKIIGEINLRFGRKTQGEMKSRNISLKSTSIYTEFDYAGTESRVSLPSAQQASIRMGTLTIGVKDKDYMKFNLLNSLFGGYFSSRLMQNIREDKGYTYGIGSYLIPYKEFSVFVIVGDIKQENVDEAKEEIFKEMNILSQTLIPQDELQRVKSYTKGEILRGLDGGFDLAEKFIPLLKYGFSNEYYEQYIQAIDDATAEDLLKIAQKYLCKEKMLTVIATK